MILPDRTIKSFVDGKFTYGCSILVFLTLWEQSWWFLAAAVIAALAILVVRLLRQSRLARVERDRLRFADLARTEVRRLKDVISNVPGIVWETMNLPGTTLRKTTFINDHVQKMLGYTPEEWLAAPPDFGFSLMLDEDRERVSRETEEVVRSGRSRVTQFRRKAKDGREVWIESYLSPIVDEEGETIGVRGVDLDITERKLAEEALRQSEAKNRGILQAMPDLMFVQDHDGVYLDYHCKNPRDLLVSPQVFLGKNMRDVLPRQLAEDILQCFERAQDTGEPQVLEYPLTADQTERWFEGRIVSTGDKLVSLVREITSRKFVEEALKRNEAQLAGIIEYAMDGIIATDESRRIVLINPAAEKMFGFSTNEAIGQPLERFIPDLFSHIGENRHFGGWNEVRRTTGLVTDLYGLKQSGERFPIEASISHIEINEQNVYSIILRDITERVSAQQALRESEKRFRSMADNAPVMIWMTDPFKGCAYVNKQWLDFTGRTLEQELNEGWTEGVHPDDLDRSFDIYRRSFDKRTSFDIEYRLRRSDGEYRWVIGSGTPRFSETGDFLGYIGTCIDITERKQSEVDLRKAHDQLAYVKNQLEAENIYLQQELQLDHTVGEIVGHSEAIKRVLAKIGQVARTDSTVLISGETGTGKELIARAIHGASLRKDRPLIKVSCAALSPTLIESELFGHEKGAFTGAGVRKLGRFELADKGTIFLDEIGELPLELQVKLLRVIQEGEVDRVGGSKTLKVDVRIIAATNRNLKLEVEEGRFREDLWYRLNVFPITAPPLRERKEDIPLMVEHFVAQSARKFGKNITSVSPRVLQSLQGYSWPGNVRELVNVVERAVIHTQGSVLQMADKFEQGDGAEISNRSLEEIERAYITSTLENTGWRIEGPYGAAKILGLHASTLRARMIRLGIQRPRGLS